jgi:glucokinase
MIAENLSEKTVLDYFILTGRSSIPRLAGWCGTPSTTALGIVRRLVAKGLLARGPETLGSRGRPVVTYGPRLPNPLLVCQFDGTELAGGLVDRDLEIRGTQTREVSGIRQKELAVEALRGLCAGILAGAGMARESVAGLSLTINAVDVGGQCLMSSVLPWVDDTLEAVFSAGLGLDVRMTRTPIQVTAEYQRRAGQEKSPPSSIVAFHVADGVSAHTIVEGRPLGGQCCLAGELGHVIAEREGSLCGCGRRGCLEAYCSGPAICRRASEGLGAGVASRLVPSQFNGASPRAGVEQLWEAWHSGDTYARAVMEDVLDRLGWGLGLVLNLLDPQVVAMHGYVVQNKPAWLEEIHRRAARWTLHAARRDNRVEPGIAELADELRVAACDYYYAAGGVTESGATTESVS